MTSRYDQRPFLRLLESYVLHALGALTEADRADLDAMTPKLQETFGRTGTWLEIVAAEMHFPVDCPATILLNWEANKKRASERGLRLHPQQFAQFLADKWSS
jgi:hypothetical protein